MFFKNEYRSAIVLLNLAGNRGSIYKSASGRVTIIVSQDREQFMDAIYIVHRS